MPRAARTNLSWPGRHAVGVNATLAFALIVAAACQPSATTPTPSPTGTPPTASPSASPSATASPTATPTPIALPNVAQVDAPSSNVVWALVAGSRFFRSADRGVTWEERSLPPAARNPMISFVSEREGWLASIASLTPCSAPTTFWHTTDGGATWQEVMAIGIVPTPCNGSVSFIDAQHGFVPALDSEFGPRVFFTTDGGVTWASSQILSDPPGLPPQGGRPDFQLGRVRAFGSTMLMTVTIRAQASPATYVYRSQDAGLTFTYAASIPTEGTLAIVTASRWLRLGPPGASFETTDAGASWHSFTTDYSQAAPISPDIVFADANVGYATVRGLLQRTIDGGTHWTTLKTPGTQ